MAVESRFFDLLEILVRHEIDFIVVGGIAAILHGAPIMTADVDILFDSRPENIERLVEALRKVSARYYDPAGRHFVPDVYKLTNFKMNLLRTDFGRLDVLPTIGAGKTYRDLIDQTVEYEVEGFRLRVLDLEAIIESKEAAGRPKDLRSLPFLYELLEMRKKDPTDD